MYTCDQCRELIWDDLFGLLDGDQHDRLHHHLTDCSVCRVERVRAEADYQRLARAARLDILVPAFAAPEAEPITIPFEDNRNGQREPRRARLRVRPWHVMAAAVLFLLIVPYAFYQNGLAHREVALDLAQQHLDTVLAERKSERTRLDAETTAVQQGGLARSLRVQVLGPAEYQPGGKNEYRVLASHLSGKPADARVKARVLGFKDRVLFETQELAGNGELVVSLPSTLALQPHEAVHLEVRARSADEEALLREELHAAGAPYVTHLSIDRPWHKAGERVYFRSVTVDRYTPTPPSHALTLIYRIRGAQGREVAPAIRGRMRTDGIGCGEFTLPDKSAAGEYTLTVSEAGDQFAAVTQRFWVGTPKGDTPTVAAGSSLSIDFFPEGGDLVADLPGRVYFAVRGADGRGVDAKGRVVDERGQVVATVQTEGKRKSGMGMFSLTPQAGTRYRLQVTEPTGIGSVFALPAVQLAGFALYTPTVGMHDKDPLHAVIRQTGPEREAIVGVFCRGRLVAHAATNLRSRETDLPLALAPGAAGVLRVTVYENQHGRLQPLAERLVYRVPAQKLAVSVQGDKERYKAGDPVKLFLQLRNEAGKPEPGRLLVSVMKQPPAVSTARFADQGLPGYFYLAADFEHPEALEQADFLVRDDPEARTALELFLSTQGWRHFSPAPAKPVVAVAAATRTSGLDGLAFADNVAQAERKYERAVTQALNASQARLSALDAEAKNWLETSHDAASALSNYRTHAHEYFRLGAGGGAVLLFSAACLLLTISGVHVLRGIGYQRRYVAGAFVSLSLCGVAAVGLRDWGTGDDSMEGRLARLRQSDAVLESAGGVRPKAMATPTPVATRFERESAGQVVSNGTGNNVPDLQAKRATVRVAPLFVHNGLTPLPKPLPSEPSPLPVREYAHQHSQPVGPEGAETIVWKPVVVADSGAAMVKFDLPDGAGVYRIRVEAHTSTGCLGTAEAKLQAR
jgi:Putative zinc-finger